MMKVVFLLATAALFAATELSVARAAENERTVWDRVYTAEQAKRGESVYLDECGRCHSETLNGGDFGPAVAGSAFWGEWKDKTMADLFERIKTTMPQDNPGRLSAAQNADVLAFLMKSNGFPAGDTPLDSGLDTLRTIKITPAH